MSSRFATVPWRGRPISIDHAWVGSGDVAAPLMVFVHEGLGSVAAWKDFPATLCAALGFRGLVYSRPGYGLSTPRAASERWGSDFLHQQAHEVLPALLQALGIDGASAPPWLFGHSDGGSIALLYAARFPHALAGVVVVAPHIFVEDISIASIRAANDAYADPQTGLRQRLARYHADPDSAFGGWAGAWLDPAFRHWRIDGELATIRCPLLAVQGLNDEYGTLEQIRRIQQRVPHAQLLELPGCGHQPQRDQPQALLAAVCGFVWGQAGAGCA